MTNDPVEPLEILVLTGGHRVDLDAFLGMVDAICAPGDGAGHTQCSRRHSSGSFLPSTAAGMRCSPTTFLVCVCAEASPRPLTARTPASAPSWSSCSDMVRGSWRRTTRSLDGPPGKDGPKHWAVASTTRPGRLHGQDWPSSGTRLASYTAQVVDADHPVCAGLVDFPVSDELYCCPVFEADVVPLLRTDASMDGELFVSTYEHVVMGAERAPNCHDHPPASDLIAWATVAERSPVVYVQPGDSAATFGLAAYQLLLANALSWVASSDAHQWANSHEKPLENVDDEDP